MTNPTQTQETLPQFQRKEPGITRDGDPIELNDLKRGDEIVITSALPPERTERYYLAAATCICERPGVVILQSGDMYTNHGYITTYTNGDNIRKSTLVNMYSPDGELAEVDISPRIGLRYHEQSGDMRLYYRKARFPFTKGRTTINQ